MATIKQKKAAKVLVGNGGNVTQAMLEVGYSPNTANTPQKLTESEGFQEVWHELIPRRLVVETHKKIIKKVDKDGQPHGDAVKGVDMAYKVDGAYAPERHINVNMGIEKRPDVIELTNKILAAHRERRMG
jgi:hypothetical protein